ASEAIRKSARGDEQAGQDDDVAVHDPFQAARAHAQAAPDRRQGNVDERGIKTDQERAQCADRQDRPPPGRTRRGLSSQGFCGHGSSPCQVNVLPRPSLDLGTVWPKKICESRKMGAWTLNLRRSSTA